MTLVFFIHFVLASVWKCHALFMYYIYGIDETTPVDKTSIMIFYIKEKQLRCENSLYIIIIIVRGMDT